MWRIIFILCFLIAPSIWSADATKPKKRTPVSQACLNCRKKHQGCDNVKPCRRCEGLGIECIIDQRKRGRNNECSPPETKKTQKINFYSDQAFSEVKVTPLEVEKVEPNFVFIKTEQYDACHAGPVKYQEPGSQTRNPPVDRQRYRFYAYEPQTSQLIRPKKAKTEERERAPLATTEKPTPKIFEGASLLWETPSGLTREEEDAPLECANEWMGEENNVINGALVDYDDDEFFQKLFFPKDYEDLM